MRPHSVLLYSKPGCHLCDRAKTVLERVRAKVPFRLETVDISQDPALLARYGQDIPVILLDGQEIARHFVREQLMLERLTQPSPEETHD